MFQLDTKLKQDAFSVGQLSLCQVLLMNDQQYPWVILVPRVESVYEIYELSQIQQHQLWSEIADMSSLIKTVFNADKVNVAALGNVVRQLHVHVIARYTHDIAWPAPVWGAHPAKPYSQDEGMTMISLIREQLALAA